jgi:hypothetical protein
MLSSLRQGRPRMARFCAAIRGSGQDAAKPPIIPIACARAFRSPSAIRLAGWNPGAKNRRPLLSLIRELNDFKAAYSPDLDNETHL